MATKAHSEELGYTEGETCGRKGCRGVIQEHDVENCSCHINPPCSQCTTPRGFCDECDWEAKGDVIINDYVCNVDPVTETFRTWTPRPLDKTKIDWRTKSHTHFSQICEGVYPDGTTQAEVEERVQGKFGGRFTQFGNGTFTYIAYTD